MEDGGTWMEVCVLIDVRFATCVLRFALRVATTPKYRVPVSLLQGFDQRLQVILHMPARSNPRFAGCRDQACTHGISTVQECRMQDWGWWSLSLERALSIQQLKTLPNKKNAVTQ